MLECKSKTSFGRKRLLGIIELNIPIEWRLCRNFEHQDIVNQWEEYRACLKKHCRRCEAILIRGRFSEGKTKYSNQGQRRRKGATKPKIEHSWGVICELLELSNRKGRATVAWICRERKYYDSRAVVCLVICRQMFTRDVNTRTLDETPLRETRGRAQEIRWPERVDSRPLTWKAGWNSQILRGWG